jgi:hypothetical protein
VSDEANYQLILRTSRGGAGIPPALAERELHAVFGDALHILERPTASRLVARIHLEPEHAARLAVRLGYTRALLSRVRKPWPEGPPPPRDDSRGFSVGTVREGDDAIELELLHASDDDDERPLNLPDARRRLSVYDARALGNLSGLVDGASVLDSFAGAGTLARTLRARGLRVVASDVDPLACATLPEPAARADAGALPFADASFDGVVTEPPYRAHEQGAVRDGVREAVRVLKPGGRLVLLAPVELAERAVGVPGRRGLARIERHALLRHGLEVEARVYERAP